MLRRAPARFCSRGICALGRSRLREGFEVHVVYESCGLGYGLYRALLQAGAHCYVIAPQQLDERNTRVKTDGRDGRALCLRLDRYLAGNKDSLAVIRVPSEREERARHWGRQREQLVGHRQKMEAQGRSLLISHGLPAPARWWRPQSWNRLGKLLPTWILPHLELYRPALLALDQEVRALAARHARAGVGEILVSMWRRASWGGGRRAWNGARAPSDCQHQDRAEIVIVRLAAQRTSLVHSATLYNLGFHGQSSLGWEIVGFRSKLSGCSPIAASERAHKRRQTRKH